MSDIVYERLYGQGAMERFDELAALYLAVYAEPPYNSGPKYSRTAFLSRTSDQATRPDFVLITARQQEALIGFAFGFRMAAGGWWANVTPAPPEILAAQKFAVIELLVLPANRNQGIGGRLISELLEGHDDEYATLASPPEAPAHAMYLRWGWQIIGHFTTGPPYSDVLVLPPRCR